jgi:hypothetical protein
MAAGIYNMTINQGATFIRTFIWYSCASCDCACDSSCGCGTSSSTPIDLTGFTAEMQIRSNIQSATVLYTASTANGDIVLGGIDGTVVLTIAATDTAAFDWTRGVYDMNLTSSGGVVTRLVQGSVVVSPEVTR